MGTEVELQSQYQRFCEEANAIKSQIEFIEDSVILSKVQEKGNELTRDIIPSFKSITEIHSQIDNLIKNLKDKENNLVDKLEDMDYLEIPEEYLRIDGRSDEGELLQFICEIISGGETDKYKVVQEITIQLEAMCMIKGENIAGEVLFQLYDDPDKIAEFVDIGFKLCHNIEIYKVKESISLLKHHTKLLDLIDIRNMTNIYRQGFIQLIATFDAIVFDCFKIKFNNKFFEWLKLFKDCNVKYSEIANCNDFDTFQQVTIEEKPRNCYLKDLFNIIRSQESKTFWIDSIDLYCNYIEMINRRNCHIHNRGVDDKSYLGLDKSFQGNFNIYNVKMGDYLSIDKECFSSVFTLCVNFLENFVKN